MPFGVHAGSLLRVRLHVRDEACRFSQPTDCVRDTQGLYIHGLVYLHMQNTRSAHTHVVLLHILGMQLLLVCWFPRLCYNTAAIYTAVNTHTCVQAAGY